MAEDQLFHVFLEESRENLQSIEEGLLELEKSPHDPEIINIIFRAMHTIKGGAGMMGFSRIGSLAHQMESILEGLRGAEAGVDERFFNLLFNGSDLLKKIFESSDLEGEAVQENIETLIQALKLYSMEMQCDLADKKTTVFEENIEEYDWKMVEDALLMGEKICQVNITLHPGCVLKSARVFMVIKAVEKFGRIVKTLPSVEILAEEKFDLGFTLLLLGVGSTDGDELAAALEKISEVEAVEVIPDEKCDLKKLLITENLQLQDRGAENVPQEENQGSKHKYYRIGFNFSQNVLKQGIDPLFFIYELKESGTILESYVNIANLPALTELDAHSLYIYWVIFYESTQGKNDLENLFLFAEEQEISLEDISGNLDLWFSDEKRLGELLVDRGLVTVADVEKALVKQKRIGELLVEQGKITAGQVENVMLTKARTPGKEQLKTIRVDTNKLESIMNNIAELLIAQSHVKETVLQHDGTGHSLNREVQHSFEEVDKIIRRLQEEVMNASMVPVGDTFMGFQRVIRDLARDLGKEVELVVSGKETELDKKVIEQISDPLKHLIRNAVDHGLEGPGERVAAGKNRRGSICLNAFHQEGNIVIEISDDGRGLDQDVILRKAREKNMIAAGEFLTETEIHHLLFRPGFTTAGEISDISGRGVGLDVVQNNIENLRGKIEVISQKGRGTKFSIKLPLTLAIIDGIMVRVGEERFIIPLTSILEFIKAKPGEIVQAEGKGQMLHLRKEYIPLNSLYLRYNIQPEFCNPLAGILIILKEGSKKMALLVDEIIGQEQVVIKSVKDFMTDKEGMAGATILGDGSVAFILEVSSLFRMSINYYNGASDCGAVGLGKRKG